MSNPVFTGDDEFPDNYEIAMKQAQFEDQMLREKYPDTDPNELEGEWLVIEDHVQKLVGPWSQNHSFVLGMIDTLVDERGIPRECIAIQKGKRSKWKMEGLESD